jgi:small subunit ribosomal protein S21
MSYKRNYRNHDRRREYTPVPESRRPSNLTVVVHEGEFPERAIKRFLKKCKKNRILDDYRKHEYYEKPSVKRKRAAHKRKRTLDKLRAKEGT